MGGPHAQASNSPTLPVPSGWSAGFLPGADVLMMPLPGGHRTTPSFTVRRWAGEGEQRAHWGIDDPRRTPDQAGTDRGLAVARDRWSGGHWFGLRFLRLVTGPDAKPLAEVRWLLWSITRRASAGFDLMTAEPDLDATAVCAVADLPLLEKLQDSMAASIPADWSPARSEATAGAGQIRVEAPATEDTVRGPEAAVQGGAWAGTAMLELPVDGLAALRALTPGQPWSDAEGRLARAVVEAGLGDPSSRTLTERASLAAAVLQDSDEDTTLSVLDSRGAHTVLSLHRSGGVTAAVVPVSDHSVLFGLYPAERAAEMVLRGAGLGPSDSRGLEKDLVPLTLLQRRTLDPDTPLPTDLQGDPRWRDLWDEPWALWTLTRRTSLPGENPGPVQDTLVGLNSGRWGNHLVLQSERSAPAGEVSEEPLVRLEPVQTSSLFITLLDRLVPARSGR